MCQVRPPRIVPEKECLYSEVGVLTTYTRN